MDLLIYMLLWWRFRHGGRTTMVQKVLWPLRVAGERVGALTQEFRPPAHMGVDLSIPGHYTDGIADVVACAAGKVVRAFMSPRGGQVLVDHGTWASSYSHMEALSVKLGDRVEAGDVIGPMGADPLDAQHIRHLHFQVAVQGVVVDPQDWL